MSAPQRSPKELAIVAIMMAIGLGAVVGLQKLGEHFGVSRFTTYATAIPVLLAFVAAFQWRKLHPPNRPGLVLSIFGLTVLAICSVINEFWLQFFVPSRIHFVAAILPSLAYESFRYIQSKRGRPDDAPH